MNLEKNVNELCEEYINPDQIVEKLSELYSEDVDQEYIKSKYSKKSGKGNTIRCFQKYAEKSEKYWKEKHPKFYLKTKKQIRKYMHRKYRRINSVNILKGFEPEFGKNIHSKIGY